jgi:hypothetical protein
MRPIRSFLAIAVLTVVLAGCESSTDLADVTMEGKWDGMGELYSVVPNFRMSVNANTDGTFSGNWTSASYSGSVSQGTRQGEVVQFTLFGFPGGARTFQGELTNEYRIEGTLTPSVAQVTGNAVFRRSSFSSGL